MHKARIIEIEPSVNASGTGNQKIAEELTDARPVKMNESSTLVPFKRSKTYIPITKMPAMPAVKMRMAFIVMSPSTFVKIEPTENNNNGSTGCSEVILWPIKELSVIRNFCFGISASNQISDVLISP